MLRNLKMGYRDRIITDPAVAARLLSEAESKLKKIVVERTKPKHIFWLTCEDRQEKDAFLKLKNATELRYPYAIIDAYCPSARNHNLFQGSVPIDGKEISWKALSSSLCITLYGKDLMPHLRNKLVLDFITDLRHSNSNGEPFLDFKSVVSCMKIVNPALVSPALVSPSLENQAILLEETDNEKKFRTKFSRKEAQLLVKYDGLKKFDKVLKVLREDCEQWCFSEPFEDPEFAFELDKLRARCGI